ncbi:MAG: hypothetical protein R3F07_18550 [Opitutaceae bacterium]
MRRGRNFQWVDHLVVDGAHRDELARMGLVEESVPAPAGVTVMHHPKAMMPRFLLAETSVKGEVPLSLAIRPEFIADFAAAHNLEFRPEGGPRSRYRRFLISEENGVSFFAVERLADRGFVVRDSTPDEQSAVASASELWRTRKRKGGDDADGFARGFLVLDEVLQRVDRDVACQLFFEEERRYWEGRNRAARLQRHRQELLGLGWGNHDHHTFRCSRRHFSDVITFLGRLGFEKRERFYAGAEAGWGAQVLEQPGAGLVVFADVDLMPEETEVDFSSAPLPGVSKLGTVGLWCALHGDSFLQAGMHHLEARFDFYRLRDQLAEAGIATMKPFSDFDFLRQAFTEGEIWAVEPARLDALVSDGRITAAQAETFRNRGAIGSHLENLQRRGGFKGFNQKAVSVIIAETDPRNAIKTIPS